MALSLLATFHSPHLCADFYDHHPPPLSIHPVCLAPSLVHQLSASQTGDPDLLTPISPPLALPALWSFASNITFVDYNPRTSQGSSSSWAESLCTCWTSTLSSPQEEQKRRSETTAQGHLHLMLPLSPSHGGELPPS